MIFRLAATAAFIMMPGATQAVAQDSAATASPVTSVPGPAPTPCCAVASGTIVEISIDEPLDSKTSKIGQQFKIHLAAPLQLSDGHIVLPAGTPGVGEVIHTAQSRMGGKAGELLLVARYLDLNGVHIPLRGFRFGGQGKDNVNLVFAATVTIGVVGYLISGGEKRVAPGTMATAKIAVDTNLPPLSLAPVSLAPVPVAAPAVSAVAATTPSSSVPQQESKK